MCLYRAQGKGRGWPRWRALDGSSGVQRGWNLFFCGGCRKAEQLKVQPCDRSLGGSRFTEQLDQTGFGISQRQGLGENDIAHLRVLLSKDDFGRTQHKRQMAGTRHHDRPVDSVIL